MTTIHTTEISLGIDDYKVEFELVNPEEISVVAVYFAGDDGWEELEYYSNLENMIQDTIWHQINLNKFQAAVDARF